MRPFVLVAFLAWAYVPGLASAIVPDPAHCTVPAYIDLVGSDGGIPDPAGQIVITVRDVFSNPIPTAEVILDFSNCTDTRLSLSQGPGVTLNCLNRTLTARTDAAGRAFFTAMGAANVATPSTPPSIAPGAGALCCRVFAEGVQLGNCTVATPDINGVVVGDGVNTIDHVVLLTEIGASASGAPYRGRDDLSHDGGVNGFDLSTLLLRYLEPGGSADLVALPFGGGYCP